MAIDMNLDSIFAIVVVAGAALYLLARLGGISVGGRRAPGCGNCPDGGKTPPGPTPLHSGEAKTGAGIDFSGRS